MIKKIASAQASSFRHIKSRKSARKWIAGKVIIIQSILMEMWFVRNEELHNNKESTINKKVHRELNLNIDQIYRDKPHPRLLPVADNLFFRRNVANVKRLRREQKERWVKDAKGLLTAYKDLENDQTRIFNRFFTQAREATVDAHEDSNTITRDTTLEETKEETGEVTE